MAAMRQSVGKAGGIKAKAGSLQHSTQGGEQQACRGEVSNGVLPLLKVVGQVLKTQVGGLGIASFLPSPLSCMLSLDKQGGSHTRCLMGQVQVSSPVKRGWGNQEGINQ